MLTEENLAVHNNTGDLLLYFNRDALLKVQGEAGGNSEAARILFTNAQYKQWSTGNYEGEVCHLYKFSDGNLKGKYAVIVDSYGSCSGCDPYEDMTGEELVGTMRKLVVEDVKICEILQEVLEVVTKEVSSHESQKLKDQISADFNSEIIWSN